MGAAVEKMEAQLKLWSLEIDRLTARTQKPGAQAGFDALMHIDELKALLAIAQSKFDEFRAAGGTEPRLRAKIKDAWNELDAAFKNSSHRRRR